MFKDELSFYLKKQLSSFSRASYQKYALLFLTFSLFGTFFLFLLLQNTVIEKKVWKSSEELAYQEKLFSETREEADDSLLKDKDSSWMKRRKKSAQTRLEEAVDFEKKELESKNKQSSKEKKAEADRNLLSSSSTAVKKISLNEASMEDLLSVPGIGQKLASRILSYREEKGKFQNLEELMLIKGIKENKFLKLKSYFVLVK